MTARKNPHAVALGRKGGAVRSPAKAAAARQNGRKGGRRAEASPAVCVHGTLRRRCEACDLADRLTAVEQQRDALGTALREILGYWFEPAVLADADPTGVRPCPMRVTPKTHAVLAWMAIDATNGQC